MISDDDLLLYYYRDGLDATERARIGTALAEQPELAQRLHRLVAQLDTAAEMPDVPVPAHIQQRWQSALARAAHINESAGTSAARTVRRFFTAGRWQLAAAAVVVVAVARNRAGVSAVTAGADGGSRGRRPGVRVRTRAEMASREHRAAARATRQCTTPTSAPN